ncbi:nitrogen permease regulator 2 [Thamnocephalis sphaerospora]|uniref:Nitrogen permease regulator 2 n=1 Tax=Thamnocephalis sphaerospora TaxID=78915 RepID=A0A4P9XX26_9FUNG|nr:nitrogen permease regulator 2 [Thamnocephalis sphaerospora]|eukprot:RKP10896.1 nitrogen permease regulator 2 [Thamnocephalis sphaerospora]
MYVQAFHFPRLAALFYAEFHPTLGPTVTYDVPEGALTSPDPHARLLDFDAVSEYVIPKPSAIGRLLTLTACGYKIVGYPMCLPGAHYPRNELRFNLVFVFSRHADTRSYEPVVQKMAETLRTLETEGGYLFEKAKKDRIRVLIEQIYEDLNSMRECLIPLDDKHTINLRLHPVLRQPPLVHDYDVPLLIVAEEGLELDTWDITARKIVQHIDGVQHVRGIAKTADVDEDKVRRLIRHLIYYGHAVLLDIFQFSNTYRVRKDIRVIVEDPQLQNECLAYITKTGFACHPFSRVLTLYSLLKPGITVRNWADENQPDLVGVDIRRMIAFGVANCFLHRIHTYPYLPAARRQRIPALLQRYLDGTHHYDEICVAVGHSRRELCDFLSKSVGYLELSR